MKKLKFKIKKWIFKYFLKRYLGNFHPTLFGIFQTEFENKINPKIVNPEIDKRRKEIIKTLSSSRFKKHFYKIVDRELKNSSSNKTIKSYGDNFWDKLHIQISSIILRVLDRKLYNIIKMYKKWGNIDDKIDNYLLNTTLTQRLDRAVEYGIISKEKNDAVKKIFSIKSKNTANIIIQNSI